MDEEKKNYYLGIFVFTLIVAALVLTVVAAAYLLYYIIIGLLPPEPMEVGVWILSY